MTGVKAVATGTIGMVVGQVAVELLNLWLEIRRKQQPKADGPTKPPGDNDGIPKWTPSTE